MDIHLLERLKDIVRSAGTTVRSAQDAAMGIREKSSHVDLVTLYDPMVQEFLRSRLMTLLPEAGFLGEEDATHDIAGRRQLFIVDPIDGTMNFIRGLHHSSISVALAVDGVVTHARGLQSLLRRDVLRPARQGRVAQRPAPACHAARRPRQPRAVRQRHLLPRDHPRDAPLRRSAPAELP